MYFVFYYLITVRKKCRTAPKLVTWTSKKILHNIYPDIYVYISLSIRIFFKKGKNILKY